MLYKYAYTYTCREIESEKLYYQASIAHQLCNLPSNLIYDSLPCAFVGRHKPTHTNTHPNAHTNTHTNTHTNNDKHTHSNSYTINGILPTQGQTGPIKELFLVRNPLNRIISAYYFWGELYRLKNSIKNKHKSFFHKVLTPTNSKDRAHELRLGFKISG